MADETTRREDVADRLRRTLVENESLRLERDKLEVKLVLLREKHEALKSKVRSLMPQLGELREMAD